MPELPEVESVRRGLARARLRAPLTGIWRSDKPLRIGATWRNEQLELLSGRVPARVTRRGKYLVWEFADPAKKTPDVGLLIHLGMTGRVLVQQPDEPQVEHTHLRLDFADGRQVRFVDPRRFGGLRTDTLEALHATAPLHELGPEPLGGKLTGASLAEAAGRSRRCIRDVLLDQSIIAGVGNIYALEALFEAGIDPRSSARRLRSTAWDRIADAVVRVLEQGIENGGTTIRDYQDASGAQGRNQTALWVYGRAEQPCRRCQTTLEGFVLGGRGAVRCPTCQPRPPGGWVR